MYRRLETANVLHSRTVCLHCLHVLVEDGKDLIVEDLVLSNAVCHLLQGLLMKTEMNLCLIIQVQKEVNHQLVSECVRSVYKI